MAFDPMVKLRQAISGKQKINKSHDSIFTQDFGFPQPVLFDPLIPGTSAQVKCSMFSRLAPLAVPTFGDVRIELNAFFIPLRLLQPGINEKLNNTFYATSSGLAVTDKAHYTTNKNLAEAISQLSTNGTSSNYDFYYNGGYYIFTDFSKRLYFILNSLGYGVNLTHLDTTRVSMLPLLAFARVYCDYLVSPNYRKNAIATIGKFFVQQETKSFTTAEVVALLNFLSNAIYDPDFFTSAWQDNNSPGSDFKGIGYNDPYSSVNTGEGSEVVTSRNSILWSIFGTTPKEGDDLEVNLSDYGFALWQNTANRVKRMAFVGSRWFDRQLAEIGIKPKFANHDQVEFLGSFQTQVQISDVMSTAGTSDNELGDYAGKGISYFNDGRFSVETDERGYLMILSTIRPRVQYYQGRERHVLHVDPDDFWQPDYDNIGMQPIRNDELYSNFNGVTNDWNAGQNYGLKPDGIFGFSPRYSEYAYKGAKVIGDFQVKTLNTGLDSYHLFRKIKMPSRFAHHINC